MRSPLRGNPRISCDSPCHGYPATDWAVPEGTPVYAMHDGVFYRRGPYPQLGRRDPGLCADVEAKGLMSRSAHLSRYAISNGTPVKEGDLLGYSGNTGFSAGPHVHSYVIVNGVRWGVLEYLNSIGYQWAGDGPALRDGTDDDMRLVQRIGSATKEWSLFHPSFAGPTEIERGYYVIRSQAEADDWARLLYQGSGSEQKEPRDVYIRMQASARIAHAAYLRALPQGGAPNLKPVLDAIAQVPTAAQNGQAARAAIVK